MNNFDKIPNLVLKKLSKEEYEFISIEGTISLEAWNDFQSRQTEYGSLNLPAKSTRIIRLNIGGDMILDEPQITKSHLEAFNYTLDNSETIRDTIIFSLLNEFRGQQKSIGSPGTEYESMLEINDAVQFKELIWLLSIHIMNVENDGIAYVGYEFGCAWDQHHGLGIMTHKNRVCKIGGANTSFLTWVAEEDLETYGGEILDSI